MPGDNLTRVEAQERAQLLSVESYTVDLDLTTGPETFRSVTTVTFDAQDGARTFIDAITSAVHSVVLNGAELGAGVADGTRIQLDGLRAHNVLTIDADMAYTNTGEGLHRFVDPVDGEVYLYSQFEVPDSRRVFPVFEQPDLKATFQFTVKAPQNWVVVSNSPAPIPVDGVWAFDPTPRISSYITALIAGPYKSVHSSLQSSSGRTIPLGIYARASLFEHVDADSIFETTRQGFAYYEEKFGYPYPFAKYDQLFVPEFNAGAMENAGTVTFTETYVFRAKVTDAIRERRVVTILHELAHMWFGDLVTMKWWNDLWLNESFAEWASTMAAAEATEWKNAWATFQAMEKSWAYKQDQLPSTHPIVATINDLEDVQVNFDGITYAKGGSVLKQLAAWVGIDAFFAGVGAYFRKHEFQNTELKDLLAELEVTSGRELTSWSKLWLETAGVNTLKPEVETDATGSITAFRILQTTPAEHPTQRPHRLAVGFYSFPEGGAAGEGTPGRLVRTHRVELDVAAAASTDVPELVGLAKPALVLLNDDDLAYAKIRLDDESWQTALARLSSIADPLARSLVWGAAWDATRDGEVTARSYIDLVLRHIAPETESTILRTTLTQLVTAARMYVDPATREATVARIGDALWQLAHDAEPASDAQFQFVKFFANVASTPAHADLLDGLSSGDLALDGLTVDSDLEWDLLVGLVLTGRAGETEIAAQLERDNTATGHQNAARARGAIPTVEAKRAALTAALTDPTIPNITLRWLGQGFQLANDPAPLQPFIGTYFDALVGIWQSRSYKIAEYIVQWFYPGGATGAGSSAVLYPGGLATQEVADATHAWLDAHPEIPALRRLVVENLDGVERAVRAQAVDRG